MSDDGLKYIGIWGYASEATECFWGLGGAAGAVSVTPSTPTAVDRPVTFPGQPTVTEPPPTTSLPVTPTPQAQTEENFSNLFRQFIESIVDKCDVEFAAQNPPDIPEEPPVTPAAATVSRGLTRGRSRGLPAVISNSLVKYAGGFPALWTGLTKYPAPIIAGSQAIQTIIAVSEEAGRTYRDIKEIPNQDELNQLISDIYDVLRGGLLYPTLNPLDDEDSIIDKRLEEMSGLLQAGLTYREDGSKVDSSILKKALLYATTEAGQKVTRSYLADMEAEMRAMDMKVEINDVSLSAKTGIFERTP